jgi:hypothetical protein
MGGDAELAVKHNTGQLGTGKTQETGALHAAVPAIHRKSWALYSCQWPHRINDAGCCCACTVQRASSCAASANDVIWFNCSGAGTSSVCTTVLPYCRCAVATREASWWEILSAGFGLFANFFNSMYSINFVLFNKYCSIVDQLGSKDSSRDFQLNCLISYFFTYI